MFATFTRHVNQQTIHCQILAYLKKSLIWLILFYLHRMECKFKVTHKKNVKSTNSAVDLFFKNVCAICYQTICSAGSQFSCSYHREMGIKVTLNNGSLSRIFWKHILCLNKMKEKRISEIGLRVMISRIATGSEILIVNWAPELHAFP